MNEYYLFLDESETHTNFKNQYFCIAGAIIKKEDYETVKQMINNLKILLWHDVNAINYIFHEKDVKSANHRKVDFHSLGLEYEIFKQNKNVRLLYAELAKILETASAIIIGSCVNIDLLNRYFSEEILSDKYLIAMQILLENYCHFLRCNQGTGVIYYESRQEHQDKEVRMRINHIKAMGTMFVSPYAMQKHLKEIYFPTKKENIAGLQIADFIPNSFARKGAEKEQSRYNIYQCIRKLRYDGGIQNYNRFGIKYLP